MRFFTVHTRPDRAPLVVVEGFRWGAFVFGPLWLLCHRANLPAALEIAVWIALVVLTNGVLLAVLLFGVALFTGLNGNDLRRWSLERRRFLLSDVVAAHDPEEALGILLARRPEQATRLE